MQVKVKVGPRLSALAPVYCRCWVPLRATNVPRSWTVTAPSPVLKRNQDAMPGCPLRPLGTARHKLSVISTGFSLLSHFVREIILSVPVVYRHSSALPRVGSFQPGLTEKSTFSVIFSGIVDWHLSSITPCDPGSLVISFGFCIWSNWKILL